uniref:Uncharacterized protein n=1 Tax=Rhipicephalus zambeziensis TaxID=60191 RepID=A0A224YAY4_9ACAR
MYRYFCASGLPENVLFFRTMTPCEKRKLYTHLHIISWKSARVVVGADNALHSNSACKAVALEITRQGVTVLVFFYANVCVAALHSLCMVCALF